MPDESRILTSHIAVTPPGPSPVAREFLFLNRPLSDISRKVLLSAAPSNVTLAFAEAYKDAQPSEPPTPITWKEILAEEPFEGQHWEGVYGLPAGSTIEGWETRSDGSTPSLSPWDEDDSADSDGTPPSFEDLPPPVTNTSEEPHSHYRVHYQQNHLELIERLKARQYWRDGWKIDVDVSRPFDIGDPSTLGVHLQFSFSHYLTVFARSCDASCSWGEDNIGPCRPRTGGMHEPFFRDLILSIDCLEIYSRTRCGARGIDVSPRPEEPHDLHYLRHVFFGGMYPVPLLMRCKLN